MGGGGLRVIVSRVTIRVIIYIAINRNRTVKNMRRKRTGTYPQIRELGTTIARTQYHLINGHGGKRVTHRISEKTRGQGGRGGPNHSNIGRGGVKRQGRGRGRKDRKGQRPSTRGRKKDWWDKGETSF